tara:strand:+ start:113 stop:835 length:723 start_codon:yes stop_codon:yes gene_type:complete
MPQVPKIDAYSRSYNSFSGVDIKAVMGKVVISELQAISYSVTREKAPIYTMGSADPRAFSRGKRGIAGTLIFVMFDRHVVLSKLGGYATNGGLKFQSDIDDIRPQFKQSTTSQGSAGPTSSASLSTVLSSTSGNTPATTVQNQESPLTSVGSDQELAGAWYADQIPPFDITLAAANEYGALSVMRIFGCELLNEGYGVSIDDIVSEQQHTYVCRAIIGWAPVPSRRSRLIAAQPGVSTGT